MLIIWKIINEIHVINVIYKNKESIKVKNNLFIKIFQSNYILSKSQRRKYYSKITKKAHSIPPHPYPTWLNWEAKKWNPVVHWWIQVVVCVCVRVWVLNQCREREREKPVATRIQQLSATEPPSIHKYSSNHISSDFENWTKYTYLKHAVIISFEI